MTKGDIMRRVFTAAAIALAASALTATAATAATTAPGADKVVVSEEECTAGGGEVVPAGFGPVTQLGCRGGVWNGYYIG
jgi:hypothetical protein